MDSRQIGTVLMGLGVVLLGIGLLAYLGALSWFGRLPGDIRYEGESTRVVVPITSMILVSVALSLGAYLLRRLF